MLYVFVPHGCTSCFATATWARLLGAAGGTAQRALVTPRHRAAYDRLWQAASLLGRARLAACTGGGAGLWLGALPSPGPTGTALHGPEMRAAVRLWLGAPPRPVRHPVRCACGAGVDVHAAHFQGACPSQGALRTARHHHISRLVAAALRADAR